MTSEPVISSPSRSFSPESHEWRRFWRIVLFSTVPSLLIVVGPLEWFGWSIGDTYTPGALIRALDEHPDLVWMELRVEALAGLKLAQVARERPDVLVMGQSRVEEVRTSMFRPYTFYNLSRVSWPFDTYAELLRHFPEGYRPKLIVFNADFFMFSPKYSEKFRKLAPIYGHDFLEHLLHLNDVGTQIFLHPQLIWKRTALNGHPARGTYAILDGLAFSKDGSMWRAQAGSLWPGNRPGVLMGPAWKGYVAEGDKMGEAEMAALKEFVDLAREMGIPTVAVQMPIYGPLLRVIEKDPNYRILQDFRRHEAEGYFERLGLPFFDCIRMPPYSEDNRYFYDGIHPGEPLTAAVIADVESDPRVHALLPRLDVEDIRRHLEADKTADQHLILRQ